MGTKNDTVIAHLGERIGKLSARCQALARMCNELLDKNREALARVREVENVHEMQARGLRAANDELKDEQAERRKVQADNDRLRTEVTDYQQALTLRSREIEALQAQLTDERARVGAKAPGQGWPSIPDVNEWVVGRDYISPHLTGSWKLIELRSDLVMRLTRQGAPAGCHAPDILAEMDNSLCLSEGPF